MSNKPRFQLQSILNPNHRKYTSTKFILLFSLIIPNRYVKKLQRRLEKHLTLSASPPRLNKNKDRLSQSRLFAIINIAIAHHRFRQGKYGKSIKYYNKIPKKSFAYKFAQSRIKTSREQLIRSTNQHIKNNSQTKIDKFDKHDQPLLSIIMPVYNVKPFLEASILSVLNQAYRNFELIIVNDASTDDGLKIIEMFAGVDERIKVISLDHNTLGGAGIPSNIGLEEAQGEYIGFIDSDDFVTRNSFSALMAEAIDKDADLVIGNFCTFTDDDREVSIAYDDKIYSELPKNETLSPQTHPMLFRLSPVPWRKIYKHDFLEKHQIRFPEGDYFYEDNPLHWFVLSKANNVVLTNEVISYHRMAREGQTMSSSSHKLASIANHINTIGNFLANCESLNKEVYREFYDYFYRSNWIVKQQVEESTQNLIKKRIAKIFRQHEQYFDARFARSGFTRRINMYESAYKDVDLTIVIPAYNCQDYIEYTLNSVLQIKGFSYNVLLMDDGSTDETLDICRKFEKEYEHIHVFCQGNRGAGRARNGLIPLIVGRYSYFLDADDTINSEALELALTEANNNDSDLHFFQYCLNYPDENTTSEMFNSDQKIWNQLSCAETNQDKQVLLSGLINYPWNRIIKTKLLHDENIFFGSTVVHNDIPYHWHSIATAKNIGYSNVVVCTHNKFTEREQITNISDERRLAVFEAIRFSQKKIENSEASKILKDSWFEFATKLLDWSLQKVPSNLKQRFKNF